MSWEFKVGQRVVCVKEFGPYPGQIHAPARGEQYTIRTIDALNAYGQLAMRFVEIVNPIYQYLEGPTEVNFNVCGFRPLVSDTQPWLKEVLETPPTKELEYVPDLMRI